MIAETYKNSLYSYQPDIVVDRFWVHPRVMVGGSIIDASDWMHLVVVFQLTGVVNVETEHSDVGKEISDLCEAQVPDNGTPFDVEVLSKVLVFARRHMESPAAKLYVHCQMGGSRSPAFAYLILRGVLGIDRHQALEDIRNSKDWTNKGSLVGGRGPVYGDHPAHKSYLKAIDDFLDSLEVRREKETP